MVSKKLVQLKEGSTEICINGAHYLLSKIKFQKLISLEINELPTMMGHILIVRHAEGLYVTSNDFCWNYRKKKQLETLRYFLCKCPKPRRSKLQYHGGATFRDLKELVGTLINLLC